MSNEHIDDDEFHRQERVLGQLVHIHAALARRHNRIAIAISIVLTLAAFLAGIFAFSGTSDIVDFRPVGLSAKRSTWLGWFAVFTFLVTITEQVIRPRELARAHRDSMTQLAALRSRYRVPMKQDEDAKRLDLSNAYDSVMRFRPDVPERTFLAQKSKYLRNRAISDLMSKNPHLSARAAKRQYKNGLPSIPRS